MTAVLAPLWQDGPNLVRFLDGHQRPMRARMAGLSTRFPPALLPSAPLSRFAGESIGGRWLGRVRRVLLAQRQLSLQIRNLLFGIRDLLFGIQDLLLLLGELLGQFLDLP